MLIVYYDSSSSRSGKAPCPSEAEHEAWKLLAFADKPWPSKLAGLTLRYLHEAAAVIPSCMQIAELTSVCFWVPCCIAYRAPEVSLSLGYTQELLPHLGTVTAGTRSRPCLLFSCIVVLLFSLFVAVPFVHILPHTNGLTSTFWSISLISASCVRHSLCS